MTRKSGRPTESAEDYQLLFNSIDQGFCVIELIFDERGRPVDYRFLEVNDAFEEQTGLANATGRRISELAPGRDEHWFKIYGRIALTGKPERFTNEARQLGRWFDVFAFRIGAPESRKVAVLFRDVTGRKRDEDLAIERQQEREATERQARRRAELLHQVVIELESFEGVEERASRLIEILVPAVVDFASVELSGLAAMASSNEEEPRVRIARPLAQEAGILRLGFDPDRDVSPAEFDLATEVAERAQLLLGNALLRREERRVVERLQQALLPEEMLDRPEAAVAAHYQAGSGHLEVGGDWYDSFELPSGRMGFVVGDVVGHGLEAAAAMGRLRVALAALAADTKSPGALLTKLDRFALGPNGCDFATAFYAILDPDSGELRYASAGHPPPLVVSPSGDSRWLDEGRSIPLGVSNGSPRPDASTTLTPGSLVVFYSDGLIERRGRAVKPRFGPPRTSRQIPSPGVCNGSVPNLGERAAARGRAR